MAYADGTTFAAGIGRLAFFSGGLGIGSSGRLQIGFVGAG